MAPPLFSGIKREWNYPVDCGLKFRGKRILGDHKTIKGFVVAIIAGEISFLLIKLLGINLPENIPWYFGGLLGFAALFADAVKSFFKRQINVAPGKSWFPWDQLDWIMGALIVGGIYLKFELIEVLIILGLGLLGHLVVKVIGYWIKVNESLI